MAVIVASGGIGAALAAKAATLTIPIVFMGGADPVKYGLVATLNRPGGNITGVTSILNELAGKRLELLLELVPKATTVGHLVANQSDETQRDLTSDLLAAARALGQQVIVLECRGDSDFEAAFATRVERQPSALVVSASPLAFNNRAKILALGGALQNSRDISATPIRLGRRSDELRPGGHPSSNRILFCPPDSQGRQAC
jgi:putative tryptophan/tyrosine transport system substrate-binding protein